MKKRGYRDETRTKVLAYLGTQRFSLSADVARLGGTHNSIHYHSVSKILNDLEREGVVEKHTVGNRVVIWELKR